jgi:hypothetical protein
MKVESDWKHKAGGYIHKLSPDLKQRIKNVFRKCQKSEPKKPPSYWHEVVMSAVDNADAPKKVEQLSRQLGLSITALSRLMVGWDGKAWTFPMWDGFGNLCGVRTRYPNGNKRSVKGSRNGLFYPLEVWKYEHNLLFICEGPTDTAAILDLGFDAIGRPCALGGCQLLTDFLAASRRPVVLMADRDERGIRGMKQLIEVIKPYVARLSLLTPPRGIKDAREWLNSGVKHDDIVDLIQ